MITYESGVRFQAERKAFSAETTNLLFTNDRSKSGNTSCSIYVKSFANVPVGALKSQVQVQSRLLCCELTLLT